MAIGKKTGGRKKGTPNKATARMKLAARKMFDEFTASAGDKVFQGDALTFIQCVYKNLDLDLDTRLQAANAALRFERPALQANAVAMSVTGRIEDMTDEQLKAVIANALPAPIDVTPTAPTSLNPEPDGSI